MFIELIKVNRYVNNKRTAINMINSISNSNYSNVSFQSIRKIRIEGRQEIVNRLLYNFMENKGVDSFLKKYDADLTIKCEGKMSELIFDVVNPNRKNIRGFFKRLLTPKKIRIRNKQNLEDMYDYLTSCNRCKYVDIDSTGEDRKIGYYITNNINSDLEAMEKLFNNTLTEK